MCKGITLHIIAIDSLYFYLKNNSALFRASTFFSSVDLH